MCRTGGIMPTAAQVLDSTFQTLFPQLTSQARSRLAAEVVRIVNSSTEQGWDLAAVTLILRGAQRNHIGTTLQSLRVRAGLTQEEVTAKSTQVTRSRPWHGSKLTRIESGRVTISSFADLNFLLRLYGVTNEDVIDSLWGLVEASQPRRTARKAS